MSGPRPYKAVIALTFALIYIHLCTRINYRNFGGWTQNHAASHQLHRGPHFNAGSTAMTELLGVAEPTTDELPPRDDTDESAEEQALKDADAAAAAAIEAAAQARARADRLRRLVQSGAPDPADTDGASETDTTHQKTSRFSDDRSARRNHWLGLVCAAVVVLLLYAAGAAGGYMAWEHHVAVRDRQKSAEFVAGARQAVVALMSMGFQNARQNTQRVVDDSTGQFRDDFTKHLNDFTKDLEQSKVTTTVTVNGAAVQSIKGDSATVLVAATSDVSNSAGAQHEPRPWRLIVTMTRDGGRPKMSKLEFIP